MKNIIRLLAFLPLLTACDDLFEPAPDNIRGIENMHTDPSFADGILGNAYILLPYSAQPEIDYATDDAVTNDSKSDYIGMNTGSWTSSKNPTSQWTSRRAAIQYLNIFLDNADRVIWSQKSNVNTLFNDRMKGEAYGLRALQMLYLLQAHGGWTADGRLLGVPIVTTTEDSNSDLNHARNTFQQCLDQLIEDADKAIELLPLDYVDVTKDEDVPSKYRDIDINATSYTRVNGATGSGRMTGRIAEAIRAQAALLAASPAFAEGTNIDWAKAADYSAVVLDRIGGISGLADNGHLWYEAANVDAIKNGNPAEIIWRGSIETSNNLEKNNFPPSLRGTGRVNPTQNLVDAFPSANGYPIANNKSEYDAKDPYSNRDPRLAAYIQCNGTKQGVDNAEIITGTYGTNNDALNHESGHSTRTGYYLRKLLRSDCNPNPTYNTQQKHYTKRIRYTEIFLAYAEAANEAWGPTAAGSHSYSAYDVIKAIRKRAGVGTSNNDAYLESVKNDKDQMRQLIRNERRLELCFENIRFWDLRRWKADLSETAKGIQIEQAQGTTKYTVIDVEPRRYKEYMNYGPIPYNELLKWSNLEQNQGW